MRINEHKEVKSTCFMCKNTDHRGGSTEAVQVSFSCESTDKSYFLLSGSETSSLEKDALDFSRAAGNLGVSRVH